MDTMHQRALLIQGVEGEWSTRAALDRPQKLQIYVYNIHVRENALVDVRMKFARFDGLHFPPITRMVTTAAWHDLPAGLESTSGYNVACQIQTKREGQAGKACQYIWS